MTKIILPIQQPTKPGRFGPNHNLVGPFGYTITTHRSGINVPEQIVFEINSTGGQLIVTGSGGSPTESLPVRAGMQVRKTNTLFNFENPMTITPYFFQDPSTMDIFRGTPYNEWENLLVIYNESHDAYTEIREIASLKNTVTDQELDSNFLFRQAEDYIVGLLPDVEIRDPQPPVDDGKGRYYPRRPQVIQALVFLAISNFILFGDPSLLNVSTSQGTGAVKSTSKTVDDITIRTDYDVSTSATGGLLPESETRGQRYKELAEEILESLGAVFPIQGQSYTKVLVSP